MLTPQEARELAEDLRGNRANIKTSNLTAYDNIVRGADLVSCIATIADTIFCVSDAVGRINARRHIRKR